MNERAGSRAGTRVVQRGQARPPRVVVILLLVLGYLAAFGTIADLRLHQSVEDQRGVNLHGYRGTVARQRKIEQVRILLLGGTWAFGQGLVKAETPATYLERDLHQRWRLGNTGLRTTVINLAGPGDGPASYLTTLEDYRSLDGDVIAILDDPDRVEGAAAPWRHQSAIFRRTGYFPLLLPTFSPERTGDSGSIEHGRRESLSPSGVPDCATELRAYCDGLAATIDHAVSDGKRVLIVRPPAATPEQRAREHAAKAMLDARFNGRADVRIVDLSGEQDLLPAAADAGRDLTAGEADRLAELMTGPMLELIRQ